MLLGWHNTNKREYPIEFYDHLYSKAVNEVNCEVGKIPWY